MVDTAVLEAVAARRVSSSLTLSTKRSTSHCNQSVGVSKYSERRLNPDSNVDFYFAGIAQLIRASPFQGEGCGFESHYLLKWNQQKSD